MTFSIATEPRNKRTAKVQIFRGAQGKYARNDGRNTRIDNCDRPDFRTIEGLDHAIAVSLASDTEGWDYESWDPQWDLDIDPDVNVSVIEGLIGYTSQSTGFVVRSTRRRRARNAARKAERKAAREAKKAARMAALKAVEPTIIELPEFDEAGRPIVYKTDDCMAHRALGRRR